MKKIRRTYRAAIPEHLTDANNAPGLSLNDLEIPVLPLLTKAEEWRAGARVRTMLNRIVRLLPRHPEGYRKFLARMGNVVNGGGLVFAWLPFRDRMAEDFETATRSLRDAHRKLARSRRRAVEIYETGAELLTMYVLDPETLFEWAKEVVVSDRRDDPMFALERYGKVARILRRAVEILERQRDFLVLPNFRLVLKDVFRYHPLGMRRSDLFQEGVLGLHKAAFRYDPARGTRFSTYATYWIRQSIRKALIDKARMIRVPQAVQEDLRKAEPSLAPNEAARVRRVMGETVLFSAGDAADAGDRNSFVVSDPHRTALDESLHTEVIPKVVMRALESLNTRSREVLKRRFGLAGDQPQTLEEIGKLLSLSRERIRQIERDALDEMSHSIDLQELFADLEASAPQVSRN